MNKLTIIYQQVGGRVISDGVCEELALDCWRMRDKCPVITTSTALFITALRVLVVEGTIPRDDLIFIFEKKVLTMDSSGRIEDWPEGFDDVAEKLLMRLMRGQTKLQEQLAHDESMSEIMETEGLTEDEIIRTVVTQAVPTLDLADGWKFIPVVHMIKAIRNRYSTSLKESKQFFDDNRNAFIQEICHQDPSFGVYLANQETDSYK